MKELQATQYIATQYTDENVLYKTKLVEPQVLNRNLTYLFGKDTQMFNLLTLTEGKGNFAPQKAKAALQDTQYTWPVMGRMKLTSEMVGLVNSAITQPGIGGTSFEVIMKDSWLHNQWGATSPDGASMIRVEGEGVPLANNQTKYTWRLQSVNPNAYVDLTNFQGGKFWGCAVPTIAASKSEGNASNTMSPGKMTNQYGFYRFSKGISGNIGNKVVPIQLDGMDVNGKATVSNMWMPFEMRQFEIMRKTMLEEDLWHSEYNRNSQGEVTLKDHITGLPIPRGAGIKEILTTAGHYDTYNVLSLNKIDSIINKLIDNRIDSTPMEIAIHSGSLGLQQFDQAVRSQINGGASGYYTSVGRDEIKDYMGGGASIMDGMQFGRYFSAYKTIHGHIVYVVHNKMFDHGTRAATDRANNNMVGGFPRYSGNMVFLDHSMNDAGDRNITFVCEEGREYQTGIYKGMTNLPGCWGSLADSKAISTRTDEAYYEVIQSGGINMYNATTSFWLENK